MMVGFKRNNWLTKDGILICISFVGGLVAFLFMPESMLLSSISIIVGISAQDTKEQRVASSRACLTGVFLSFVLLVLRGS